MNQVSVAFTTDASVMVGYAQTANERLGLIDFVVENTGLVPLFFQLQAYDGITSPSGWVPVGATATIQPQGAKTLSYTLLSKRVGFFGSGIAGTVTVPSNLTGVMGSTVYRTWTTASISAVIRNKGDLRGAQIDITAVGRRNWGFDDGVSPTDTKKKWGQVSGTPGAFNASAGAIDFTKDPKNQ